MTEKQNTYLAIDIKSFYASVECRERGLDPLDTYLVVADEARTDKTICLAATPPIKSYGISGRSRLYEVRQRVNEVNAQRLSKAPGRKFSDKAYFHSELQANPSLELDFIIAPPRMAFYMEYSTTIYEIYKKYISPEDIIVYSIDEVFIDATKYLEVYGLSPRELSMKIIKDIFESTGMTVTAGIGSNLYLAKVAMDIVAKHIPADENGVRIAELDELEYRRQLWDHRPLTDFWRIGKGTASRLEHAGIMTMGDIARCSIVNEDILYKLFGKNTELIIDHAWGWEPCTVAAVKSYTPSVNCISSGQVLKEPYSFQRARVVLREMADALAYDLLRKGLVTDQIVVTVGFDRTNLSVSNEKAKYTGEVTSDFYGRAVPKHAHGTKKLEKYTCISSPIIDAAMEIYDRTVNPELTIRRLNITANRVIYECRIPEKVEEAYQQMDLFELIEQPEINCRAKEEQLERERKRQEAVMHIRNKYGKNSILRGMSYEEGATAKERNAQIGGHKA